MFHPGIVASRLEYHLLRKISEGQMRENGEHPSAYQSRSKLGVLFGPQIWPAVAGKHVIDFGCGGGKEAIEIAQHGARRVTGIDVRDDVLRVAKSAAEEAGVSDRCVFATRADEPADLILSSMAFEHYGDPEGALRAMSQLLKPGGRVLVAFGPPWFHPLGGHLFSIFPWAHVIFTERALIGWRSDFKSDGATRFCEVAGGLNQMTVRRFRKLVEKSDFSMEHFEAVPIRRLRFIANSWTREFRPPSCDAGSFCARRNEGSVVNFCREPVAGRRRGEAGLAAGEARSVRDTDYRPVPRRRSRPDTTRLPAESKPR